MDKRTSVLCIFLLLSVIEKWREEEERKEGREKDSRESEREKRKGERRKELRKRGREGEITRKRGKGNGRRYTNYVTRAQVIYGVILCRLQEKKQSTKIRNGFVITTLPILPPEIHVQLVDGYVVH